MSDEKVIQKLARELRDVKRAHEDLSDRIESLTEKIAEAAKSEPAPATPPKKRGILDELAGE